MTNVYVGIMSLAQCKLNFATTKKKKNTEKKFKNLDLQILKF